MDGPFLRSIFSPEPLRKHLEEGADQLQEFIHGQVNPDVDDECEDDEDQIIIEEEDQ